MNLKSYFRSFLIALLIFQYISFEISADTTDYYNTSLTMNLPIGDSIASLRQNDPDFSIVINGKRHESLSQKSYLHRKTLMLPLREICVAFGFEVHWNPTARSIQIKDKNISATAKVGSALFRIGEMGPIKLPNNTLIRNGIAYVPIDFFSELLQASISVKQSDLHLDFQYTDMNRLLKIQNIAKNYRNTLEKQGYTNLSIHIMYTGNEVGSVLYKATSKDGVREILPFVFDIKNGKPLSLSLLIKPKEVSAFKKLASEKYKSENLDLNDSSNYYLLRHFSQSFVILLKKDEHNYTDQWIPVSSLKDYLQINL